MKRIAIAALFCVSLAACSKKSGDAPTAASGSAPAPGSAAAPTPTDKGSAAPTGSGSAVAEGSGSAGSNSAAAGSGSADGSATAGSADAGSAAKFDFDKLDHEQKVAFMKTKVMPAMKKAFQEFDKDKYANFGCKTCHGKDPTKTKYKMPNPELPKLDFAKLKAGKQEPKIAEFMGKVVKPQMAKLLEQPEMTPTQEGFGCLECHEQKK